MIYIENESRKLKNFFWLVVLIFLVGCHSSELDILENQQYRKQSLEIENSHVKKWLEQLTSPKFFEYTQAARKFLEMGTDAVPYLRENLHLTRESNDSVVPVCLNLLQILFQQQKEEWVISQEKSEYPEIQKIAKEEIVRRKKSKEKQ